MNSWRRKIGIRRMKKNKFLFRRSKRTFLIIFCANKVTSLRKMKLKIKILRRIRLLRMYLEKVYCLKGIFRINL